MAVRNFTEMGDNFVDLTKRLLANQNLCKYLEYADNNPLKHADIENTKKLLHSRIKIVPKIEPQEDTKSTIVLLLTSGNKNEHNPDFKDLTLIIDIYVPFEEWIINDTQLRPFAIMSEIQSSLDDKQIKGLGRLQLDFFSLGMITDEMGTYRMTFSLDAFN